MNQRSTKPVGLPNIDNALTYDKSDTKAFSEVDTNHDGKISDAEIKALLEKEHLYKRLTKTLGITNLVTAIVSACLCFALVYAIKDTASASGNLVDQSNGNALHTASKEEFAPVIIDESALDGLIVIPTSTSVPIEDSALRTEVGTVSKSGFLVHIENAETNTASGFAKYKKSDGKTTTLVPYRAMDIVKTKDSTEVSLEVEIKGGEKLQFGVTCKDPATTCSIFALTAKRSRNAQYTDEEMFKIRNEMQTGELIEVGNRKLMQLRSGAGLNSLEFKRTLGGKYSAPPPPPTPPPATHYPTPYAPGPTPPPTPPPPPTSAPTPKPKQCDRQCGTYHQEDLDGVQKLICTSGDGQYAGCCNLENCICGDFYCSSYAPYTEKNSPHSFCKGKHRGKERSWDDATYGQQITVPCLYEGSCANGDLISPALRTQENHCGSCNGGYYLNNKVGGYGTPAANNYLCLPSCLEGLQEGSNEKFSGMCTKF